MDIKTPIIVCGAMGRMGRQVIAMASHHHDFLVRGAVIRPTSMPEQSEPLTAPIYEHLSLAAPKNRGAVIIDFSSAMAAPENLEIARANQCGFLLASTGHSDETLNLAKEVSSQIPVVIAPNTSLMANLLVAFSKIASSRLSHCEVSILDLHHADKKDAPSGTAKALIAAINEKSPREIEVRSMRKGHVPGEHTVYFFNDFDRLELTHRVADRKIFAEGALKAAQFLFRRSPGLYDMNDVLNLNLTIKKST